MVRASSPVGWKERYIVRILLVAGAAIVLVASAPQRVLEVVRQVQAEPSTDHVALVVLKPCGGRECQSFAKALEMATVAKQYHPEDQWQIVVTESSTTIVFVVVVNVTRPFFSVWRKVELPTKKTEQIGNAIISIMLGTDAPPGGFGFIFKDPP